MPKILSSVQFLVVMQFIVGSKLFTLIYVGLIEKKNFNLIITVWYSLVLTCSVSQDHLYNFIYK